MQDNPEKSPKDLDPVNESQESQENQENQADPMIVPQEDTKAPRTVMELIHTDFERNFEAYPFNSKRLSVRYRVWTKLRVLNEAMTVARRRWQQLSQPIFDFNPWLLLIPATAYIHYYRTSNLNTKQLLQRVTHESATGISFWSQGTAQMNFKTFEYTNFFKNLDWTKLKSAQYNEGSILCDFEPAIGQHKNNFFVGLVEDSSQATDKIPGHFFLSGENYHTLIEPKALRLHQQQWSQNIQSLGLKTSRWKNNHCYGYLSRLDTLPLRIESLFGRDQLAKYYNMSRKNCGFCRVKLFETKRGKRKRRFIRKLNKKMQKIRAEHGIPKDFVLQPLPKNHELATRHETLGTFLKSRHLKEHGKLMAQRIVHYRIADTLDKLKQIIYYQTHKDDLIPAYGCFNLKNFFHDPALALKPPIKTKKYGKSVLSPKNSSLTDAPYKEYRYRLEEAKNLDNSEFYTKFRINPDAPIENRLYLELGSDMQDFKYSNSNDFFHNKLYDPTCPQMYRGDEPPVYSSYPPYSFESIYWWNDFSIIPEFQRALFGYIDQNIEPLEAVTPPSYLLYRNKLKTRRTPRTHVKKLSQLRSQIYVGKSPNLRRRVSGYAWPDMTFSESRRVANYLFNPYEPFYLDTRPINNNKTIQIEIDGQGEQTSLAYQRFITQPNWIAWEGLSRDPIEHRRSDSEFFFGQKKFERFAIWGPDPKVKYDLDYLYRVLKSNLTVIPWDESNMEEEFWDNNGYKWLLRPDEIPIDDDEIDQAIVAFDPEEKEIIDLDYNFCYGLSEAPGVEPTFFYNKRYGIIGKKRMPFKKYQRIYPDQNPILSEPAYKTPMVKNVYSWDDYNRQVYSFQTMDASHYCATGFFHVAAYKSHPALRKTLVLNWHQLGVIVVMYFAARKFHRWSMYYANPANTTMREWLTVFDLKSLEHWHTKDRVHMIKTGVDFQQLIGGDELLEIFSRTIFHLRALKKPLNFFPLQNSQGEDDIIKGDTSLGYLLIGPPGTGKTFLARAVADTAEVPVMVYGREVFPAFRDPDAYIRTGYVQKLLALVHVFESGRYYAPSIVYIDEIDSLAPSRYLVKDIEDDPEDHEVMMNQFYDMLYVSDKYRELRSFRYWADRLCFKYPQFDFLKTSAQHWQVSNTSIGNLPFFEKKFNFFSEKIHPVVYVDDIEHTDLAPAPDKDEVATLTRLLVELDGMNQRQLAVIGSTNRPAALDPAVIRPGRLSKVIYLDLPDTTKRIELLKLYSEKKLSGDIDWESLSEQTGGLSHAHLDAAMNVSRLKAVFNHVRKVPLKLDETVDQKAAEKMHSMGTIQVGIQDTVDPWKPYQRALITQAVTRLQYALYGRYVYDGFEGFQKIAFAITDMLKPKDIERMYKSQNIIVLDKPPEDLDLAYDVDLTRRMAISKRIRRKLASLDTRPLLGKVSKSKQDREEARERFKQSISEDVEKWHLFNKACDYLHDPDASSLAHLLANTRRRLIRFASYAQRQNQFSALTNALLLKTGCYAYETVSIKPSPLFKVIRGQLIQSNVQFLRPASTVTMMQKLVEYNGQSMFAAHGFNNIQAKIFGDQWTIQRGAYYAASRALVSYFIACKPDSDRYYSVWDSLFQDQQKLRSDQRKVAEDLTRQCQLYSQFEDHLLYILAGKAGESFMLAHKNSCEQSTMGQSDLYTATCIADIMVQNNLWPYPHQLNQVANTSVTNRAVLPPQDKKSLEAVATKFPRKNHPMTWWQDRVDEPVVHKQWEQLIGLRDPVLQRLQVVRIKYDRYTSNTLNNTNTTYYGGASHEPTLLLDSEFGAKFLSIAAPNFNSLINQQDKELNNQILLTAFTKLYNLLDTHRECLDHLVYWMSIRGEMTRADVRTLLDQFMPRVKDDHLEHLCKMYLRDLEDLARYQNPEWQWDDGCSMAVLDPGFEDGFEDRYEPDFPDVMLGWDISIDQYIDQYGLEYDPDPYADSDSGPDYDSDSDTDYGTSAELFDPGFDIEHDYDFGSSSDSGSESELEPGVLDLRRPKGI